MSGPSGTSPGNALAAPRPKKGILTATTENILNVDDNTTRTTKKRKWSHIGLRNLLEDSFVIRVSLPAAIINCALA